LSLVFFVAFGGLGQLVAPRQTCLRNQSGQSRYATLEYRLRNICSNKFGIYSQPIFQTFGFSAHFPRLLCSNLRRPFESKQWGLRRASRRNELGSLEALGSLGVRYKRWHSMAFNGSALRRSA
jgi:hypothetical protein